MSRLGQERFDILVIGGGATGCGIALDAASRGLSVALVERFDLSQGTSSRSTKLVHGGVRYLEQAVKHADRGQFHLVREALRERSILLANAPHLARPLPLLTPIYSALELPYYFTGLKLYDMLAGRANLGASRLLTPGEAKRRFPMLKRARLKGAVEYHDGQFDDARMNVELALTAAEHGAAVVNYAEVEGLLHDGERLAGAVVRDCAPGGAGTRIEMRASVVINATGPFADALRLLDDPQAAPLLSVSSGTHVILPAAFSPPDTGLLIPKTEDGRVLFLLPWQGHTLVGTTDNAAQVTAHPDPSPADVEYILRHVRAYFDLPVEETDVLASWTGLRPLVAHEKPQGDPRLTGVKAPARTARLSRDHTIISSHSGMITITGGKWTTYRKMAEDAVDLAVERGGLAAGPCRTQRLPLVGAAGFEPHGVAELRSRYALDEDIAAHLHAAYGARAPAVAELAAAGLGARLAPGHPFIEAEVIHARDVELALCADDVLARRTRLAFLDQRAAEAASGRVAELLASA
ncbi:MAG: FAD-dependent oxidoreductase [Trueperaceae bacterium]|nr:FAD-dependent oxidoreductase [Trueperaceae bacterium]